MAAIFFEWAHKKREVTFAQGRWRRRGV